MSNPERDWEPLKTLQLEERVKELEAKIDQRNEVIRGKGEDNMSLHFRIMSLEAERDKAAQQWQEFGFRTLDDVAYLRAERDALRTALEESVKLQSHYAMLINYHDGGKRLQFKSAQEWLDRLAAIAPPAAQKE